MRRIDPADQRDLRDWWGIGAAATAERPLDPWPSWEIARARLTTQRSDIREILLSAVEDGRLVGAAGVTLFLPDNTHLAQLQVYVAPDDRRRGIGRLLLAEAESRAREAGRTTAVATVFVGSGSSSVGQFFASATGWQVANEAAVKAVDLATASPTWVALQEGVDAALGEYRLELVESRIPDAYLDDYCELLTAFLGQVPLGDLDVEEAVWTPERVRANEERRLAVGSIWIGAVAIAPDGRLCGFSDLSIDEQDPRHATIGGTLVLPGHRGHRLGLGMKLVTHRRVLTRFPSCTYVETDNADVNAQMNAVNESMGYRTVERAQELQKPL